MVVVDDAAHARGTADGEGGVEFASLHDAAVRVGEADDADVASGGAEVG